MEVKEKKDKQEKAEKREGKKKSNKQGGDATEERDWDYCVVFRDVEPPMKDGYILPKDSKRYQAWEKTQVGPTLSLLGNG